MAHNLDTTAGQTAFVSARQDAWHQLGTVLPDSFTAEQAMTHGLLGDWNVRKTPLLADLGNDGMFNTIVPDRFAVVRDNPVTRQPEALGVVGNVYQVIQNEEHAAFLNALVDESGAHFETAGAIDGGRKVFITMRLPGHINVGGVDRVDQYLAAVNSHDGSTPFTVMTTPIRIVCQNTLNAAYQGASGMFRARHTRSAHSAIVNEARQALDLAFNYLDTFQEEAERMINTTLTQVDFEQIIMREFGAPEGAAPNTVTRTNNKLEEMSRLFAEAYTQEGIRDTAWAGFNALTEWADHFSPVRNDDPAAARAKKAVLDPAFKNLALRAMVVV